jgi:hypothetical protein
MNLDTRARAATKHLLEATRHDLKVGSALTELRQRRPSRSRQYLLAVTVVLALAVTFATFRWTTTQHGSAPPITEPTPAPSGTTRFDLAFPFTAVLTSDWQRSVQRTTMAVLLHRNGSYVEVVVDPAPVATFTSPAPTQLTAQSLAA